MIRANLELADIIEFLPDATFAIDIDGKIVAWNRAIEEMTGVGKEEMMGKGDYEYAVPFYGVRRPALLDLIDDDDKETESKYLYVKRRGNVLFSETYVPKVYGGKGAHVLASAAPLFDAEGYRSGSIESIRDITGLRQTETALRESEARYRAFISNSSEAIWRIEAGRPISVHLPEDEQISLFYEHGRLAECSDTLARMFGLEHAAQLIGTRLGVMLNRSEPGNIDLLRLFIRSGYRIVQHEMCRRDLKGNASYFMSSIIGIVENGRLVGAWGVQRDITDYKRAEETLRGYQRQLADIIDFLPDATFVIGTEGKVISWNKAIEEMTGIKAVDMLGKGDYEYALPFYGKRRPVLIDLALKPWEEVEAQYHSVKKRGPVIAGEAYVSNLKGSSAYLFAKASVLRDSKGHIIGAIESIRDISDRKNAEEALRRAEKKYRDIFENAVMGLFQTSEQGRLLSANLAFARILGYDSIEEVLDCLTDIRQSYVEPADRSELLRLVRERCTIREFEVQFYRKDRTTAWVCLNVRAARDRSGGYILEGTAEDVTARKNLEAKLRQSQKMEAIGTLAGGIAHDFNNMLAPIIGYSELLLYKLPRDSQLYRNVQKVLQSGCRARDLVKQILTFSRQSEQEQRPVQICSLTNEALKLLRATLPATVEIRRQIDADALNSTVMADPVQIHQVVMNLCTNAAHAMREKGGVLEIGLKSVTVNCDAVDECPEIEKGTYLRLTVSDTGHGMDEGVKQRIFDPYFTTKGPEEGTGLGLAVVYGIVQSLSGGISVTSSPGKGTTFHIYFPAVKREEAGSAFFAASMPRGKGTILVVDDEKSIAELLKEAIEQLGYDVVLRHAGADAFEVFKAHPDRFDLVITDQTMPGTTGAELAGEMLRIRPDVPIILCTGFSEMIDEVRAARIGIRAFLMKPVALRRLAEEIHRILGERNTSSQTA